MTRSALLLISGALAVSAFSFYVVRSPDIDVDHSAAAKLVRLHRATSAGVFIPNLGQAPNDAFFFLKRDRSVVLLRSTTVDLELVDVSTSSRSGSSLHFIGASGSPKIIGFDALTDGVGFKSVKYQGLYPGVDLRVTTGTGKLSGKLTIAAGVDPSLVLLKASGSDADQIGFPIAYQVEGVDRTSVPVTFEASLYGSTRLNLGPYDVTRPVVINFWIGY